MGEVWMAEQAEPARRKVAVKLIKPGMDSRAVLARFEQERQALALMDHPNIARVLEAGATPEGRPYFVMELVKGVPITTFCDERRLTPRQRLELFAPVCAAVQHAHQKGIIHRDLKPSNVLVALYGDRPVVKVIDFGVAKAVGEPLTEKTLFTGFGAVVGTLGYMSPEQASLNQLDIDTRSDVYALGVLLYELLTGTTPLGRERLPSVIPGVEGAVAFDPGGGQVIVAGPEGRVQRWNLIKDRAAPAPGSVTFTGSTRFLSADGKRLAVRAADGSVRLLDAQSGRELGTLRNLSGRAWTADAGLRRLAGLTPTALAAWDLDVGGFERRLWPAPSPRQRPWALSRDGRTFAGAQAGTGTLTVWDLRAGRQVGACAAPARQVGHVVLGPDGRLAAASYEDLAVRLWDARAGELLATLTGHPFYVTWLQFSPDGRQLITVDGGGHARLWDAPGGKLVAEGPRLPEKVGHPGPNPARVAFYRWAFDGRRLALLEPEGRLRVIDPRTAETLADVKDFPGKSLDFAADGRSLLTALRPSPTGVMSLALWDVGSARVVRTFRGHTNDVNAVAAHPNGGRVASAGHDGTVRIWDAETGHELLALPLPADASFGPSVVELWFSDDGKHLYGARPDGALIAWEAVPP